MKFAFENHTGTISKVVLLLLIFNTSITKKDLGTITHYNKTKNKKSRQYNENYFEESTICILQDIVWGI